MAELVTRVTAVTVFSDRARVVRTGRAQVEPGAWRLEVGELPLGLDPASVRAKVRGTARARLLGVEVGRRTYAETPLETVRTLEQKVESLGDQVLALQVQLRQAEEERQAVRGLVGATDFYARGLARGTMKASDEVALLDALRQRAAELDQLQQALAVRVRGLQREQQVLTAQLGDLRGARGRERHVARVDLDVQEAGDLTVELLYAVGQAGWVPLYDLRVAEAEGQPRLEVCYLAQVQQGTGEDWAEVELTLSTARPALSGQVPELAPWYLSVPAPRPPRAPAPAPAVSVDRMAKAGAGVSDGMVAFATAAEEVEVEEVQATVESSGAAVSYRVPGSVSIPADGAAHKVTVTRLSLACEIGYVAAPKVVEAAYRKIKAANQSPFTLLAGAGTVFDGDELVGATRLALTPPGAGLELYLGVDERITITRELKRRDVDRKLLGDGRRLTVGYEITVESALPAPARLCLEDQVPVPRHESIKVKLEAADPKPADQTEMGLLHWELELEPQQKRTVRFDLQIEHPREMQVVGMP